MPGCGSIRAVFAYVACISQSVYYLLCGNADCCTENIVDMGRKKRKFHNFFVDILKNMRIIRFCMDTKKDCKIPECGDLAKLSHSKLVVGAKQLRKALERGTARFVCLAKNADPAITAPIEENCIQKGISVTWVCTMQELGALCGIDVGAAAAAAVD